MMSPDPKRILIANRGEIACRVIRTCRKLGIYAIAVYSDEDAKALHVELADEAHRIGPAAPRESYLNVEAVLDAARKSKADAIHPGYGFLSENAGFAEAVRKAGLIFIGPSPSAIRAMGGKSESKVLMTQAGVPLVPGYHGEAQDEKLLLAEAKKIGWPVLLKASAGGGGKGMKIVRADGEFMDALASAKREAKSSFANDKILIEKYLERPRHVEIQVFGDSHGNYVYLFERDCSIQRRHQKVIEEAPAPHFPEKTRQAMGEAAVAAARAIKYEGAGTVEFLLDEDGKFYFMEMNTRLQVEHPVTEMITGQDLVEWQIRVAQGEKLPLAQKDLKITGHAIEARIYAEDPVNSFLPQAGRISYLRFASGGHVRVDTGVREVLTGRGDRISIDYDPMIAKLIVTGKDRDEAVRNLHQALKTTRIGGLKTNLAFLARIAGSAAFLSGKLSTKFIEQNQAELLPVARPLPDKLLTLAVLGLLADRTRRARDQSAWRHDSLSPWNCLSGWWLNNQSEEAITLLDGDRERIVRLRQPKGPLTPDIALPDGRTVRATLSLRDGDLGFDAVIDGEHMAAAVLKNGGQLSVLCDDGNFDLEWKDPLAAGEALEEKSGKLTAPMPGRVVAVHVKQGAEVKKGQPLVIIEAMKMEHTLTAPVDGIIDRVGANVGDRVDEGLELVAFK